MNRSEKWYKHEQSLSWTPESRSSRWPRIDSDHDHRSPRYRSYKQTRGRSVSDEENSDELYNRQESKEVKNSKEMNRAWGQNIQREDDALLRRGDLTRYIKGQSFKRSQFGQIRIGKDKRKNEYVVIKECLSKSVQDGLNVEGYRTYENVESEIKIHTKISRDQNFCRFIIRLLDVVEDAKYVFLILEYAPRGELREYLNKRHSEIDYKLRKQNNPKCLALWWVDSLRFMIQLLRAVKYLHEQFICHRDLSIENVVLDQDLNVKVIDFGLAQYCDVDVMFDPPGVGKMVYMSPECYDDHLKYDGKDNDMWSLGVILFFMLFAIFPWEFPYFIDSHFNQIYGIRGGTKKFLWSKNLLNRAPNRVLDLFDRIFCAQKARITVKQALRHPYITNKQEYVFEPYFKCIAPALPDQILQKKISDLRYMKAKELVKAPSIWLALDPDTREELHEFLWLTDCTAQGTTVYDARVVEDVSSKFKLAKNETREILKYFFAACRGRADLEVSFKRRPRARIHNRKQSRRLDHSPQDENRSPICRNSRPRIFLLPQSDQKYGNEESSNLEETPNEIWYVARERNCYTWFYHSESYRR